MIETHGVKLHAAVQGEGPLTLMIHGFPGLWFSWRHQLAALAAAGYRAVAIDSLGYGQSDRPTAPEHYDSNHMLKYMVGILDHFARDKAFIIGQDFGSQYAWNMAVRASDRVMGVVGMVPYDFDFAGRGGAGSRSPTAAPAMRPSEMFAMMARDHFAHVHYFQQVGPAETELGARPRAFLARLLHTLSGRGNYMDVWSKKAPPGGGYLDVLPEAPPLPWPWMSTAEFDYFVGQYEMVEPDLAFIGGLNSYRTADRNWVIGAPFADSDVEPPSLFICGAEDPVLKMLPPDTLEIQRRRLRDLRGTVIIPGAGHHVQQEQPGATSAALVTFLNEVTRESGLSPGKR